MTVDLAVDGFGERQFTGRIERINPSTEPGTRAILVFVGVPNPNNELRGGMFATGRIALAASAPVLSLPRSPCATRPGRRSCGRSTTASSCAMVVVGRRDEESGRVEIKTALPATLKVLASRFDNLKEGAPALVKGPSGAVGADFRRPGSRVGLRPRPAGLSACGSLASRSITPSSRPWSWSR